MTVPVGWVAQRENGNRADSRHPSAKNLREILRELVAVNACFVLLDDQLSNHATLFHGIRRIFTAHTVTDLVNTLNDLKRSLDRGLTVAGFLSYGAGAAFDSVMPQTAHSSARQGAPLLWFGEFDSREEFAIQCDHGPSPVTRIRPLVARGLYEDMVGQALERIRQGDIYQVNLTFPADLEPIDAVDFYCSRRQRARAPFGAFLNIGTHLVQSYSPELFFRMAGGNLEARPMKGTRRRGLTKRSDEAAARQLISSGKDLAENLMIVDLLRNDLSRVCQVGSVAVPKLFELEHYPSVWQMTSTVVGKVKANNSPLDVLSALFPCGSITGAPKIMSMRVIAELEQFDRGIYTGAIGAMSNTSAVFNVAIRTIEQREDRWRMHVGAGIVADSKPRAEWLECLAKSRFLTI